MVATVFHGDIDAQGRLTLDESEAPRRRSHLRTLANCRVDVAVEEHRDTRSIRANNYYWACVLAEAERYTEQPADDIHDAMCERFLPDERKRVAFYNAMTGESIDIEIDSRRTSKLKGDAFYDFVERVRQFLVEWLGVVTPDPDPEYWRRSPRSQKGRAA